MSVKRPTLGPDDEPSSARAALEPLVLLIDDEPAITDSLAFALKSAGMSALSAATLAEASALLDEASVSPSLIILDLSLPDGHGFDWLRQLRTHSRCPVVILSSHDDEVEHIVGLELGADDYIDKPFSPREVVARVRAILRRVSYEATSSEASAQGADEARSLSRCGALSLDRAKHSVTYQGRALTLSQLEHELLAFLIERPELVHSRRTLLSEVWGGAVHVNERTVDVHIKGLRRKLSEVDAPELIETVRGVGYRLRAEGTA